MSLHQTQHHILQSLAAKGRLRGLRLPVGIDLSSNDYLGMASHPALRAAAIAALEGGIEIGAGGSRLLRGHHPAHEKLEADAARHFGVAKTLFFANGYQANTALFTTLPERGDVVLFDALVHASMRDGLHAGLANKIKIPHNDLNAFEEALQRVAGKYDQIWIAVESIYSMDGDAAPLAALYALARRYDAFLVVDEAHATGIFGPTGKGLTEGLPSEGLITLHTCGKALGVAGGLVCADAAILDLLINKARPFIYSTAPMPLQAHLVSAALEILQAEPWRRQKLFTVMEAARQLLPHYASGSPIIPIILGEDAKAVQAANFLQQRGFDIRAVRPPTVLEGAARLRLTLNINLTPEILADFAGCLAEALRERAA